MTQFDLLNRLLLSFSLLTVGVFVAGCNTTGKAQAGATLMVAYTNQLVAEADEFAEARDEIAKARQSNMNHLEQSTVELESWTNARSAVWAMTPSNEDRSDLLRGVRRAAEASLDRRVATQQLLVEHRTRIEEARSAVQIRSRHLAATAKALSQLGADASFDERMTFYVEFFKDVRKGIEDAKEQAAQEAEAAAAATSPTEITATPPEPTAN